MADAPDSLRSATGGPIDDLAATTGDRLTHEEVKGRAASGVALLLGRGVAFRGLGFLGSLVLARLLTPEDFGLVALGLTLVGFGQWLATSGIGEALVGRPEPPTRAELRSVAGYQLAITVVAGGAAATIAALTVDGGVVTAFMMLALPLTAYRTPAMLTLQRQLAFGSTVRVELVETIVYLVFAIALAAAGLGAWSLAIATVVRYGVGTAVACRLSPAGFLLPSIDFGPLRSIIGFGARFQATGAIHIGHDLLLNAGILAVAGTAQLGLWNFAWRVLQIPYLLFDAMFNVGFPAFSRLMEGGDPAALRRLVQRAVSAVAVGITALLCPLVAVSPAMVPLLFGDKWSDVALILPGAAVALAVYGPVGIVTYSFMYASGDASTSIVGSLLGGGTRLASTLLLLPVLGVGAVGLGWAIGGVAELPWVLKRMRERSGAALTGRVLRPAIAGIVAGGLGWLVCDELGRNLPSAGAAFGVAVAAFAGLMAVAGREDVAHTTSTARRMVALLKSRRATPTSPAGA